MAQLPRISALRVLFHLPPSPIVIQKVVRHGARYYLSKCELEIELIDDEQSTENWEVRMSNSRRVPYFFNTQSKQSTWEPPSGFTKEQVESLPGSELLSASMEEAAGNAHAGQVRASHLLVKHKDSRRPASHRSVRLHLSSG